MVEAHRNLRMRVAAQNPHDKIGLRSFENLAPEHLHEMHERHGLTCGCRIHENCREALRAVIEMSKKVHSAANGGKCPPDAACNKRGPVPPSLSDWLNKALCPTQPGCETRAPRCVEGTCPKCAGGLGGKVNTYCDKELNALATAPQVRTHGRNVRLCHGRFR